MKNLLLIALVAALTFLVWHGQRPALQHLRLQDQRLEAVASELEQRAQRAASGKELFEQQLTGLQAELKSQQGAEKADERARIENAPAPDPSHQGGWPVGTAFFYLPKQYLTNAGYQLLNAGQLTDEAAALLGMSPAERESTDTAVGQLLDQFRRAEVRRMEPEDPPAGWGVGSSKSMGALGLGFDSALTYRIPDLSADIREGQSAFLNRLEQILGPSRAGIVANVAESYVRQNLDDFGAGDRIVGFVWQPESDGTHSLWYAAADARKGEGAFQRVGTDLDPNSQTAYYARLFGVKLPGN